MLEPQTVLADSNIVINAMNDLVHGDHAYHVEKFITTSESDFKKRQNRLLQILDQSKSDISIKLDQRKRVLEEKYQAITTNNFSISYSFDQRKQKFLLQHNNVKGSTWSISGVTPQNWAFFSDMKSKALSVCEGPILLANYPFSLLVTLQALQTCENFQSTRNGGELSFSFQSRDPRFGLMNVNGLADIESGRLTRLRYAGIQEFNIGPRGDIEYLNIHGGKSLLLARFRPVNHRDLPPLMSWKEISQAKRIEKIHHVNPLLIFMPKETEPVGPPPRTFQFEKQEGSPFPLLFPDF